MEVDKEQLNSLTAIFGSLPVHIITDALVKHKNDFDATINYLLELRPESIIHPPPQNTQQEQPQQKQKKDQEDLRALQNMFGTDLSQSVIATVLHSNSGDVSNAVDELLTITSKDEQPAVQPAATPARDFDPTRRTQREIQEMEDFKKLQQRMKEEEQRLAALTAREAEDKIRERERRAYEDHIRREEEKRVFEIAKLEQARLAAEAMLVEKKRAAELVEKARLEAEAKFAAEFKAKEEASAARIAQQMRDMELEKKKIELQKETLVQEQLVRDHNERLRLEAIKEREFEARRRLEEEELAKRRALEEQEFNIRRAQEAERIRQEAEKHRIEAQLALIAAKEKNLTKQADEDELRRIRLKAEEDAMKEEIRRQMFEVEHDRLRAIEEEEQKKLESKRIEEAQFEQSVVMIPSASAEVGLLCEVKEDSVKVTWKVPSDLTSTSSWIGIHTIHNNDKYEQYYRTGGIDAGSHDFKSLQYGYHVVRYYSKSAWSPSYTSTPIRIGGEATVQVLVEGDNIRIKYTPSSIPSRDWIGIYEPSKKNKEYIFTTYGKAEGEVMVAAPKPVGEYQARVFYAGSNYNEQCKCSFFIVDNDRISCSPVTVEEGATIRAEWVMRTKETSSYNWIGLYSTAETDNTKYKTTSYMTSATVGGCDIVIPKDLPIGMYELRMFVVAVGKYTTYKTSNIISVVAPSS